MPKHEVELNVSNAIAVGNRDIEIPVKSDGSPMGTLRVSRGGVDWLPSGNSRTHYAMTWEALATTLANYGTKKS